MKGKISLASRRWSVSKCSMERGSPLLLGCLLLLAVGRAEAQPATPRSSEAAAKSPCESRSVADFPGAEQWPQWRGPAANGVAPTAEPPVEWSEERHIRLKVKLPGLGHSTPVAWGQRIYLTAAVAHGGTVEVATEEAHGAHHNLAPDRRLRFIVMAVDRGDGKVLWQTTVRDQQPHDATHATASWASASPLTDGRMVWAFFGSQGLYALDQAGKIRWQKDFGDMLVRHSHGEGSSPALWGDALVVNWDHQGESFVVALDKNTGEERWRVSRQEITSWSTPLIVPRPCGAQVVIAATDRVRAYDLATGEVVWQLAGLSRNVVASPVAGDGLVFVGNSYDHQALLAIKLDQASGEITGTDAVAWSIDRLTPYVPSPLLYDGKLCFLRHLQGILTCLQAATGEPFLGPLRLPGLRQVFASPLGAAGRIYIADRSGTVVVLRLAATPEVLAVNHLDDAFSASPLAVGGDLILRGERSLYVLSEQ